MVLIVLVLLGIHFDKCYFERTTRELTHLVCFVLVPAVSRDFYDAIAYALKQINANDAVSFFESCGYVLS